MKSKAFVAFGGFTLAVVAIGVLAQIPGPDLRAHGGDPESA
jgi:hypothetical protein